MFGALMIKFALSRPCAYIALAKEQSALQINHL